MPPVPRELLVARELVERASTHRSPGSASSPEATERTFAEPGPMSSCTNRTKVTHPLLHVRFHELLGVRLEDASRSRRAGRRALPSAPRPAWRARRPRRSPRRAPSGAGFCLRSRSGIDSLLLSLQPFDQLGGGTDLVEQRLPRAPSFPAAAPSSGSAATGPSLRRGSGCPSWPPRRRRASGPGSRRGSRPGSVSGATVIAVCTSASSTSRSTLPARTSFS